MREYPIKKAIIQRGTLIKGNNKLNNIAIHALLMAWVEGNDWPGPQGISSLVSERALQGLSLPINGFIIWVDSRSALNTVSSKNRHAIRPFVPNLTSKIDNKKP